MLSPDGARSGTANPTGGAAVLAAAGLVLAVVSGACLVRFERRGRAAWACMIGAVALHVVGRLLHLTGVVGGHREPSLVVDGPHLLFYLVFAAGLVLLFRPSLEVTHRSARFDGALIGLAIASGVVALWLHPSIDVEGTRAAVAVAYPLVDVVLMVVLVAGLVAVRTIPNRSMLLLVGAVVAFMAADVVRVSGGVDTATAGAGWNEVVWRIGILALLAALWTSIGEIRGEPRPVPAGFSVVPSVAGIIALAVIAAGVVLDVAPAALWLALATLALVLVRTIRTVRELRFAQRSHVEARTDDLTGLANRRAFNEHLTALLGTGLPLAVVTLDIDGFKEVNDSLGHPAGDDLLRIVARRFRRAQPRGGLLARLGGDEFALVQAEGDGLAIAEAFTRALDAAIVVDGLPVRISASMGVACSPEHGTDGTELLRAADVAMYQAKRSRAGVVAYVPADDHHSRARLASVEALHAAISAGTIDLAYQPIIDLRVGAVVGVEALVRWSHPRLGDMEPTDFVRLAEDHGLVTDLTRLVLDRALGAQATLRSAGHDLQMNINLSAHDLGDPSLVGYLCDRLVAHDVPAWRVTLEITETALARDRARAARTARMLRGVGVGIAIDDFGVGYSSMAQLLDLPVDELKVDREMVNAADDEKAWAVLSAVTELGRALGARVVAEGIENDGARSLVDRAGVDRVQGMHLAAPMDLLDLLAYLATPAVREATARRPVEDPSSGPSWPDART